MHRPEDQNDFGTMSCYDGENPLNFCNFELYLNKNGNMKNTFVIALFLAGTSSFSQILDPLIQEYEQKKFYQIYAEGIIVDGLDLGVYDLVYMVDTGGFHLNSFGNVLDPNGTYYSDYSPQCGTGQQYWWDSYGTWKPIENAQMVFVITGYELGTINYTDEEIKELEAECPYEDYIGTGSVYHFEILDDLYLCLTKTE